MRKKKGQGDRLVDLLVRDHKAHVRFALDGKCECDEYCLSEGVCRSFRVSRVDLESIDLLAIAGEVHAAECVDKKSHRRAERASMLLRGYDSRLDVYCLERALVSAGAYLPSRWRHQFSIGYYGQELDKLRLDDETAKEAAYLFRSLVAHEELGERAAALLEMEYGSVLPSLSGLAWSLEVVPRASLVFPQPRHRDRASAGSVYRGRPDGAIMGICIREGEHHRVVDGYHRLSQTTHPAVNIIVAHDKA